VFFVGDVISEGALDLFSKVIEPWAPTAKHNVRLKF